MKKNYQKSINIPTVILSAVVSAAVSFSVFLLKTDRKIVPSQEFVISSEGLVKGDITYIANKVGPSVVGIKVVRNTVNTVLKRTVAEEFQGSGIILTEDGYIVTNYHVVSDADIRNENAKNNELTVFLPDGEEVEAKYIGGDSSKDIAVIKINKNNLDPAILGDSANLKVGEIAVAIGNPLGIEFAGSVTGGYISALNRTIELDSDMFNLIQTDAAINPGNSGGALVNSFGEVIGINTAKISISGVEGLGFAIPINDVKPIVSDLIQYGYIKGKAFIGIVGRDITEEMALWYEMPAGVYVLSVNEGFSADIAGIQKSDIIIELAGEKVVSMKELETIKNKYLAGDKISIKYIRNDKECEKKLVLSEDKI